MSALTGSLVCTEVPLVQHSCDWSLPTAIADRIQRNFIAQTMSEEELKVSTNVHSMLTHHGLIKYLYVHCIAENADRILSRLEGRGFGLQQQNKLHDALQLDVSTYYFLPLL